MNLPADPVRSMEDATLNFEQLRALLSGVNAIAGGLATLTWPGAAAFSNTLGVNHGLRIAGQNATPTVVLALAQLAPGANAIEMHYVTTSSTQVQFRGHCTDGTNPLNTATTPFFWLAMA